MTAPTVAQAPAKLNFGLEIVGRRDDGYHLLESLFVPVGLADRLELQLGQIRPAGGGGAIEIDFEMSCEKGLPAGSGFPEAAQNLAVKAARLFLERAGLSGDLSIRLEKSIPVGAGLGGGSSDAGAILRVLDQRYPSAFSRQTLLALAADLGADVPFFLSPTPSVVRGIGEQITEFSGLPTCWLLLVNPGVSLATAEVFEIFDREGSALTLARSRSTMRALDGLGADPRAARLPSETLVRAFDSGLLENDLEAVATRLCPQVATLKVRLRDLGARWVAMSGSGATVYGVFADEGGARSALERAKFDAPIWACVTRTQEGPTTA